MTSLRAAVERVRAADPAACREAPAALAPDAIARDFATRFAGIPAVSRPGPEPMVRYPATTGTMPVLLGLYGDAARVRSLLPGYPKRVSPETVVELVAGARRWKAAPLAATIPVRLADLPVLRATPRDAGPYLTLGVVTAWDDDGAVLMSVHRLLVLDDHRLTIWMVPGRRLRQRYEEVIRSGGRLPVTVAIGAAPAVVVASALSTRHLPPGTGKPELAGALAAEAIAIHEGEAPVPADAEIVLRGYLDGTTADETTTGRLGGSLPEFLGTDGSGQAGLPVLTVVSAVRRPDAVYQAVIGPGREQSVILGLAGAVSAALSLGGPEGSLVQDIAFPAAGGGMLMAVTAIRKTAPGHDTVPHALARAIVARHPFTKIVIMVDDDVDPASPEDVLWALVTRCNLGADLVTANGLPAQPLRTRAARSFDREPG